MSVRTIVVDDSPSMQKLISAVLGSDPEIQVVGTAANPEEARKMIKALDPDVITLDIEMPGMNGLDFLERLMRLRPMPVVMISSWTRKGADATIAALEIGAFSCLPKPRMDDEEALQAMCENVKAAAAAKALIKQNHGAPAATPQETPAPQTIGMKKSGLDVIAIGASTGGVEALTEVLTGFPADCPPTVVTQHMPEHFTRSFADRLDRLCKPTVMEAADGMQIRPGHVYIAPGAVGHLTIAGRTERICRIMPGELRSGHRPSVDVMFESVAKAYGRKCAAALLTGMGSDGAEGLLAIKNAGAHTVAQDRATSLVYGMPAAAARLGAAKEILPLNQIADALFGTRMEVTQNVCA